MLRKATRIDYDLVLALEGLCHKDVQKVDCKANMTVLTANL